MFLIITEIYLFLFRTHVIYIGNFPICKRDLRILDKRKEESVIEVILSVNYLQKLLADSLSLPLEKKQK